MLSNKEDTVDAIVAAILVQSVFNPERVQTTFKEQKEKYEHPEPTDNPWLTPPCEWHVAADCVLPYYEAMLTVMDRIRERVVQREYNRDPKDESGDRALRKFEAWCKVGVWVAAAGVVLHFLIKYW